MIAWCIFVGRYRVSKVWPSSTIHHAGEWHIQGDLSIDDDKMMCLEYGSARDTLGFQQRGYFSDEQWYQCAFLYVYYQSSLFGTSLRIKTCIKMLVYQPSIHHPTVHSHGLEKSKKTLPARWTGRQPAIRSGAPVPRCCAEKGRVLYTVIWALMDKHNRTPAPAKCILLCSICWWCWSLEIIHWLLSYKYKQSYPLNEVGFWDCARVAA